MTVQNSEGGGEQQLENTGHQSPAFWQGCYVNQKERVLIWKKILVFLFFFAYFTAYLPFRAFVWRQSG